VTPGPVCSSVAGVSGKLPQVAEAGVAQGDRMMDAHADGARRELAESLCHGLWSGVKIW